MQYYFAVTQSFLWMNGCGYGTDVVADKHEVCKMFKTKQTVYHDDRIVQSLDVSSLLHF